MNVAIVQVTEVTEELAAALAGLLGQLSRSAGGLEYAGLSRTVSHQANSLLVARLGDEVIGMLTLVMVPLLSGLRARIEDVVVDASARGRGIGAALTREALLLAGKAGARTVDLTSRPSRVEANRLYQSLGFQLRDSQLYRIEPVDAG
jgi:ribosomal protein S18 acetylase RimI-like enzyme